MRLSQVVNIADLRRMAKRRLPPVVFDYIDGGAEDEITLRRERARVRRRDVQAASVRGHADPDLRTTVLGQTFDVPFLLAPLGFCRMFYPRGESVAAREANAAGTAYILSTFSGQRLEDVRADAPGPLWYQLYIPGGRAVAEATIARARAAGYSALVVTIDTPVSGMRERDIRRGAGPLLKGWTVERGDAAAHLAIRHPPALGDGLSRRRRAARLSERRAAWSRRDAMRRHGRPAGGDERDVEGPRLDSRRLARSAGGQGRTHRRRRSSGC